MFVRSDSAQSKQEIVPTSTPVELLSTTLPDSNKNFIHHQHHHNKHKTDTEETNYDLQQEQQQIFINQSNNIYILAKYGQTVSLPCIIYRQKNQDLNNIHAIWHKLTERHRPLVLSIGLQQLKQDMRYRVKVVNLNSRSRSQGSNDALSYEDSRSSDRVKPLDKQGGSEELNEGEASSIQQSNKIKHLIQNWQFEIRKLTYEDAGTYQCLLPLVKPITKNITLQVIRK